MNGKGFTSNIQKGNQVNVGDLLLEADLQTIKDSEYDPTTMVIITNSADYADVRVTKEENIAHADELLELSNT